jgi:hypothetical protein
MKLPLRSSIVAVFAVTAILCVGVATAQVSKGSISGTVVDPSGAAVVGAQVKATSTFSTEESIRFRPSHPRYPNV